MCYHVPTKTVILKWASPFMRDDRENCHARADSGDRVMLVDLHIQAPYVFNCTMSRLCLSSGVSLSLCVASSDFYLISINLYKICNLCQVKCWFWKKKKWRPKYLERLGNLENSWFPWIHVLLQWKWCYFPLIVLNHLSLNLCVTSQSSSLSPRTWLLSRRHKCCAIMQKMWRHWIFHLL